MTTPPAEPKPRKKTKWYWHVVNSILFLWMLGGVNVLLLQDIPLLLFLVVFIGLFCLSQWTISRYKSRLIGTSIGLIFYFGGLAGMFALLVFIIPPFAISPQTTYLTEPRAKEFYGIDYQSVIEKELDPGVPTQDNGFRLLFETFGRSLCNDELYDQQWDHLCRYFDLSSELEPKFTFVTWQSYSETFTSEEQEIVKTAYEQNNLPWSEEAMPLVRQWLDKNDAALDVFVAAIQKPVLYAPPMFDGTLLIEGKLLNELVCRGMAKDIQVRVHYRLSIGEIDGAWDDVLAMYRLREHHRQSVWLLVSSLVNVGIAGMANLSAESVLLHSDWTTDEILEKMAEIAPFLQPFSKEEISKILRYERLAALDSLTHIANGTYDFTAWNSVQSPADTNSWEQFKKKATMRFARLGISMVKANLYYDEAEQRYFRGDSMENEERKTRDIYEYLSLLAWYGYFGGAIPVMIGEITTDLLGPATEAWRTSQVRFQTDISLNRLMFALEAYRRDHAGNYPVALEDLRERYLAEIPLDPFSGEAFRYVLEEAGFLLYSVGPNGIDDEGRGYGDKPKGDDIRRRIPIAVPPTEPEA